jgi:hypothetical protein
VDERDGTRKQYTGGARMKCRSAILAVAGGAMLAMLAGVLFERYIGTSQVVDWAGLRHLVLKYRDRDLGNRLPVPWTGAAQGRTMIALVFGQSNAGNSGETLGQPRAGVYEFYKGRIYDARDPLLGAEGNGGSVWLRLGALAIDRGAFDSVVLVPFAVGATEITRWAPGGSLHGMLLSIVDRARDSGLEFTHLLWYLGEADAMRGTSAEAYQEHFRALLTTMRARGIKAPVYVARASRCARARPNEEIRRAQSALLDHAAGVFAGPDTDTLGLSERYDGCHFSTEGLERAAELWLQAIMSPAEPQRPQ